MLKTTIWRFFSFFDSFVILMLFSIVLSFIAPGLGAKNGVLHLDLITHWGITAIFFLHGAKLPFEQLRSGFTAWRLHIFIQATTFIAFPIIGLTFYILSNNIISNEARLGFFFLCALPSTISSSVALTSLSGGNISAALFNASASNLLGMTITPIIVSSIAISANIHSISIIDAIVSVLQTLLVPFVFGQLMRPLLHRFLSRHASIITILDRAIIILIVFAAFCDANMKNVWAATPAMDIVGIIICAAILLWGATVCIQVAAKRLGFARGDQICTVFCASQKSLASGAPIAAILFGGSPALSIILLPIMVYHLLQLIIGSIMARDYIKTRESETG
jgi:sodium/bile acid cotransporter 7